MPRDERTIAQLDLVANIIYFQDHMPEMQTKANIFDVTRAVYDMAKIARSLHKRYEAACSYEWACTPKYERRTETLEKAAAQLAFTIGATVEHQRDPRGWPLIVKVGQYETRLA